MSKKTLVEKAIRNHAEVAYASELSVLLDEDKNNPKPLNWKLSPRAVVLYLVGGTTPSGKKIRPKFIGDRKLMEMAVATLAADRGLLLYGLPGTGKSWVSEHLAAAISGDSTLVVQGTAGTDESVLRYGWNYQQLIAKGPCLDALVPSCTLRGMQEGKVVRIEELTRIPSDVQDALISIMSEKVVAIPELNVERKAYSGFNIIATANNRDRGVNELSSALRRRFNTVTLPPPETLEEEVKIVRNRVEELGQTFEFPTAPPAQEELQRVVTIFRELRSGVTIDGKRVKSPTGTLSTAEAISVVNNALATAGYFGDGNLSARDLAVGLVGAVVQDLNTDPAIWNEYVENVVKERKDWDDLYKACKDIKL